ncbi:hypothetical protein ACFL1U_02140 [Patescibacteria group bacterium]
MQEDPIDRGESTADKIMKSKAMQTKVGKMKIADYLTFDKQWTYTYASLLIIAGILILIPFIRSIAYTWLFVPIFMGGLIVVVGWFGYRFAVEKRGRLSDVIIGGLVISITIGIIAAIFSFMHFLFYGYAISAFATSSLGLSIAIGSVVWNIIGSALAGIVVSIVGYVIGGGSKPKQQQ